MHAASVVLLTWAIIGAACFSLAASAAALAAVLTVLVAFVGLPHGAADHLFARPRLEPLCGSAWAPVFLAGYLAVAAGVVLGWFVAPAVTIVVFFLASAWHFGQEEPRFAIGPRRLRPLFRFARGGLVIWLPLVVHTAEVSRILAVVTPGGDGSEVAFAIGVLTGVSWAMLAAASAGLAFEMFAAVASRGRLRKVLFTDTAVVASFAVLFAVASPLVSFLAFFCGWHSVRGLRRLRRERGETWAQLAQSLAPMTGASIVLIALTSWILFREPRIDDALLRTTFIGLSGLAVPHLVLHGVAPVIDPMSRRRSHVGGQLGGAA